MRFPSGDQRGVSVSPANSSNCSAFFLPSIGAIQRCFFPGQTTFFPSGETCRSSHSSLSHPISPSKRGSPPFTLPPTPAASHLRKALRICGRAFLVHLAAACVRDRFSIRRQPYACDPLPIIAFVMGDLSRCEIRRFRHPDIALAFAVEDQATRGVWAALVRLYGNGALSTSSMVKVSARQT